MMTRVKTAAEIAAMRESATMLATVLDVLEQKLAVGMTGTEVDQLARKELKALGGKPAFLGYQGFPATICISVDDAVEHGIPDDVAFTDGQIVSLDFGVNYQGMISDSGRSIVLGKNPKAQKLVDTNHRALLAGIDVVKDGVRVQQISQAIEAVLKPASYGIVRELVGHGVGHQLHEDPNIPNFDDGDPGPILKAGMTIAIEPMATLGGWRIFVDTDGWTLRTLDGSLAAHSEHTVLVTDDGAEILTLA